MESERHTERVAPPFPLDSLVESNISPSHVGREKFFESPNTQGKIIRVENIEELQSKHNHRLNAGELVEAGSRLFAELGDKYGIIAPVSFYADDQKVYAVVDRVTEQNELSEEEKEERIQKVGSLYKSVALYFLNKLHEGGVYLWDISGSSQYVYGRREGEEKNDLYLIDTDIWLGNSRAGLCLSAYWLTRHILGAEQGLGTKFEEARKILSEFVESLPTNLSEEEEKNISGIKDFLDDASSSYDPESAIPTFE
jgi:hypothetical protein